MTVTQIMKKRKRVFFCAHNESLWALYGQKMFSIFYVLQVLVNYSQQEHLMSKF